VSLTRYYWWILQTKWFVSSHHNVFLSVSFPSNFSESPQGKPHSLPSVSYANRTWGSQESFAQEAAWPRDGMEADQERFL
jgi:hypothetical protein